MGEREPIVILAVDDEPGVLALVRRCLADDERVTLIEASSGKEAIEHVAKGATVDLLIADLRMPEMEGDEVARRVRSLDAYIKVLYLTSHADRLFEAKQQLRADEDFLDKPFTKQGLREAIALLLFGRRRAPAMTDDDKNRHDFKNQLGIILGFSDLLIAQSAAGDPRRGDFEEIHKAATAALDLLARLYPAHADTPQ